MAFILNRFRLADRAVAAGLIAARRGSAVIEMSDWESAQGGRPDKPTVDERKRLAALSVSDEVIGRVAEQEPQTSQVPSTGRWVRRPAKE